MSKSTIEVTPKAMFGYVLFIMGILLLIYTAIQCILLVNGTFEPLKIEISETSLTAETAVFFGIILQIGMYGLLIAISYILIKTGINITKT